MTFITLICAACNKEFEYYIGEYNRQTKQKGRTKFFCSRSCSCSHKNYNLSKDARKKLSERMKKQNAGNNFRKRGEFAYYLNKGRNRKTHQMKRHEMNLTESYLSTIWTGFCALSGVSISKWNYKVRNTLCTASLDRIDSTKGYVEGNVQFVAYGINLAKNIFSDEEVKIFLKSIVLASNL